MDDFKTLIGKVATGATLTRDESAKAFDYMMSGEATPSQMGGFLMGLRLRGETVDEITGAVATMRAKMQRVAAPPDATDVLGALGVKIDLRPDEITRCIYEAGIGFMFAPAHHPAMKHVGPSRAELGTRTMFNLLGPQSNPAGARRYMLGVYAKSWVEPVAAALLANRAIAAWVVHGDGGLDELSTTGPSFVASIKGGNLTSFEVTPEDAGLPRGSLADLKGADPAYNAGRLRE